MPDAAPPDARIVITREALRDGSLLAEARRRMLPGTIFRTDPEIAADLAAALARHPPDQDVWLFGYGSLMWNPAIEFAERRGAVVRGWHRRFCLWLHAGRGSPDNPGLMLALDRGGSCAGVLFDPGGAGARGAFARLAARAVCGAYRSRVTAATSSGPVRAATFVVNRAHAAMRGGEALVAVSRDGDGHPRQLPDLPVGDAGAPAMGLRDRSLEQLHRWY
jgi:cation transport protein ChaC